MVRNFSCGMVHPNVLKMQKLIIKNIEDLLLAWA